MVVRRVDELDPAGRDQLVQPLDLVVGQLGLGDRALEGGAVQRAFLLGLGEERLERFVLCSKGGDGKAPSLVVVIDAPRARQSRPRQPRPYYFERRAGRRYSRDSS
jgi:hypothetical protein